MVRQQHQRAVSRLPAARGQFTFFDYPGAVSTLATGINDAGLIVGFSGDLYDRGFVYDGTT